VLTHAGRTLALIEGGVTNYELTDELDTVGTCDFDGTLAGGYTAHPHRDPHTGELHAVPYSFAHGRTVQYSVIDTRGRARRTVDIEVSGSPMMHDFSSTDKYVVIYDLPLTFHAVSFDERRGRPASPVSASPDSRPAACRAVSSPPRRRQPYRAPGLMANVAGL
jgi:carotenoid cleavage dioxygenase-like enzyme